MWEANDDVGMSMVAHGYGIASVGSPNLMFSNIFWGYLVRSIPTINGTLGYSIATLGVLIAVGTVLLSGLYRFNAGLVESLTVFVLVLLRPVLFPQFTINAGLLAVAAVMCLQLYAKGNNFYVLLLGFLLAFAGWLVRSIEFILVFCVALPVLPWRKIASDRPIQIGFSILALVLGVSFSLDRQAQEGQEWKVFKELNPVRAAYTDFGAHKILKLHPDILDRYNYSINDINLISNWFFVDSRLSNPNNLKAMLAEAGSLTKQDYYLANGYKSIDALLNPKILPLVFVALFLAVIKFNLKVTASWGLFIMAIFALGVLGRPGIMRVYYPVISLLIIASFLAENTPNWRNRLGVCALILAAISNTSQVISESERFGIAAESIRNNLIDFPNSAVIVWSTGFPFESVCPVLGATPAMHYRLYGMGVLTFAPFSVSYAEQKAGRGFLDLLASKNGVPIIASGDNIKLLETYCKEHHNGQLKDLSKQYYGAVVMNHLRCDAKI